MNAVLKEPLPLQFLDLPTLPGNPIHKVVRHRAWVPADTRISLLADALTQHNELQVVGILTADGQATGLVSRTNLFNLLGKPFGREILGKRPVSDILEFNGTFEASDNLFAVAERLQDEPDRAAPRYYLTRLADGRFAGIFSNRDLILHLSTITRADIKLAGSLQERMVPADLKTTLEHTRFEGFSHAAQGVGGDFYHVCRLGHGKTLALLCDVSGKGVAAAIITSLLWGMVRSFNFQTGLRAFLTNLNEALIQTFHLERHVTGLFVLIDRVKEEAIWADLGHGLAWARRGRTVVPLRGKTGNLPLGLDPEQKIKLHRMRIRRGDEFLVITDGLNEQVNPAGEEFGTDPVTDLLVQGHGFSERLWQEFTVFRGQMPLLDDASVLKITF